MARMRCTNRKRLNARATPASIIYEYQTYAPCYGDDLGEFLAHFRRLWSAAEVHGVTHYDGIMRLADLLPSDWQGWARSILGDYIFRAEPHYDLVGDFPSFVGILHFYFDVYGHAPRGPYLRPGDLIPIAVPSVQDPLPTPAHPTMTVPLHVQVSDSPPRTSILGRRSRDDFEAGPSRPRERAQTSSLPPSIPLTQPLAAGDEDPTGAAALDRRLRAIRMGKAPIVADDDDDVALSAPADIRRIEPLPIAPAVHPSPPRTYRGFPDRDAFYADMRRHLAEVIALQDEAEGRRDEEDLVGVPGAEEPGEDHVDEEEDPEEDSDEEDSDEESYESVRSSQGSTDDP